MPRVIAVANQKGGVGKTTTTINIGVGLSQLGRSVILVDFDPQASLTQGLGVDPDSLSVTIYDALIDEENAPGLDLPSKGWRPFTEPMKRHQYAAMLV